MTDDTDRGTIDLTRRRALAGLTTLGAASAAAGAGTMAYFSDSESSSGNTVKAGTLNLDADYGGGDGDGSATTTLSVNKAHPGEFGSKSDTLKNTGSVDGQVSLKFGRGSNSQNDSTKPEPASAQPGDLGDVLEVTVKVGSNTIRSGTFNGVFDGTREFYNWPSLSANAEKDLKIEWAIPSWAGNHLQTDSVSADIDINLLQDTATIDHFADVVVESSDSSIASVVNNEASSGDTVVVKDGYTGSTSNKIKTPDVTVVGESHLGPTVGRITAARSNVAIIGLDVQSDLADYTGISVEPNNGATSGVVIRNNHIHDLNGTGKGDQKGDDEDKNETFGVLSWSSSSSSNELQDLVVARNTIENIADTADSQGFGVFVEGTTFDKRGLTIEHNTITNVGGYSQDGDTFPGVGVAVLPELTNPDNSITDSGVVSNEANAVVWNNDIDPEVGVSLAGKIGQVVVANNNLTDAGTKVLTEGASPSVGNIGITSGASTSVVSGTARYIQ